MWYALEDLCWYIATVLFILWVCLPTVRSLLQALLF